MNGELIGKLREIQAHLYVANLESVPSDDQIIMEHVRESLSLVQELLQNEAA